MSKEKIPTLRDYQRYVGDSFKDFNICIRELNQAVKELKEKVSNQQINNMVLADRIFQLEEKERQRAREDHDREALLDGKELLLIEKYLDFLEDGGNPANWQEGVE